MLWLFALHAASLSRAQTTVPSAEGLWPALRHELGDTAQREETRHFLIASDAAPPRRAALAERLEAVYAAHVRWAEDLRLPVRRPAGQLAVLYFANYRTFEGYLTAHGDAPPESLGGYLPEVKRAVFFDFATYPPLEELRTRCGQAPPEQRDRLRQRLDAREAVLWLSIVQHEAAHQVQFELGLLPPGDRVPTWLREGLAMLFEVPLESPDVVVPRRNELRLYEYRKLCAAQPPTAARLQSLVSDEGAWCGGPCYPLAWALTCYLYDQQRPRFIELMRTSVAASAWPQTPPGRQELFESICGPLDAAFARRLHAWTESLPLDTSAFAESHK